MLLSNERTVLAAVGLTPGLYKHPACPGRGQLGVINAKNSMAFGNLAVFISLFESSHLSRTLEHDHDSTILRTFHNPFEPILEHERTPAFFLARSMKAFVLLLEKKSKKNRGLPFNSWPMGCGRTGCCCCSSPCKLVVFSFWRVEKVERESLLRGDLRWWCSSFEFHSNTIPFFFALKPHLCG